MKPLKDARLIGAERAAALQHQRDGFVGRQLDVPAGTRGGCAGAPPSSSPAAPTRARLRLRSRHRAPPYCMYQPWLTINDWPGQRRRREGGQEQHRLRDVFDRGEHAVDRAAQHHALDDLFFADAQLLRLLGNLLVDERRAHEARTHHMRAHIVLCAFLRQHAREPEQTHAWPSHRPT